MEQNLNVGSGLGLFGEEENDFGTDEPSLLLYFDSEFINGDDSPRSDSETSQCSQVSGYQRKKGKKVHRSQRKPSKGKQEYALVRPREKGRFTGVAWISVVDQYVVLKRYVPTISDLILMSKT